MITNKTKDQLILSAIKASKNAYAPYSNYSVGAALLSESGEIFTGVNVENAAFPSSICAERVAITKAVSEGHQRFVLLAVVTKQGGMPCGACRQVISEFSSNLPIVVGDFEGNIVQETTISSLLPYSFGAEDLKIE